jgi:leucyl aminopeptidase (aminopeptidase T)
MKAIAHAVVTRTLGVKEGDVVTVTGDPRDLELLEDLTIEVAKAGGHPLPILTTERLTRMSYDEVPEKYDSLRPVWSEAISNTATAGIAISGVETPDLLAAVPPSRIAARNAGLANSINIFYKRNVRSVDIGNGMYPTHATAAQYGMSRDQLATFFWSAMTADFSDITANGKLLQSALANGREIHITDKNGTDLRLTITRAKWRMSDGTMTSENIAAHDVNKYLPAGELYSAIDYGSAEGTVVADHAPVQGKDVQNLTVKIAKGNVVSMSGSSGVEVLQKAYDAVAAPRKSEVTVLDFGLNPGIRASVAKTLRAWVPEGMVTIGIGTDRWAGGTNTSAFLLPIFLASATVTVDGKVIIENGNIKR